MSRFETSIFIVKMSWAYVPIICVCPSVFCACTYTRTSTKPRRNLWNGVLILSIYKNGRSYTYIFVFYNVLYWSIKQFKIRRQIQKKNYYRKVNKILMIRKFHFIQQLFACHSCPKNSTSSPCMCNVFQLSIYTSYIAIAIDDLET